jgi:hypothetical protein
LIFTQKNPPQRHITAVNGAKISTNRRVVNEEEGFFALFQERRSKLRSRWDVTEEIWRKKLEARNKVKYAPIITVEFEQDVLLDDGLASVVE